MSTIEKQTLLAAKRKAVQNEKFAFLTQKQTVQWSTQQLNRTLKAKFKTTQSFLNSHHGLAQIQAIEPQNVLCLFEILHPSWDNSHSVC